MELARPERFELPTFWFVARHSIQLSYGRVVVLSIGKRPECKGFYDIYQQLADNISTGPASLADLDPGMTGMAGFRGRES
jgi:hypothetical protein